MGIKVRNCEIMQQVEFLDLEYIKSYLNSDDTPVKDFCYIIHDKDIGVKPHMHLYLRLKDSYDSKYISSWFRVPEQYVGRVKGSWGDVLKYSIHENAPEKYQYSSDEVWTNFDFVSEKENKENFKVRGSKVDYRLLEILNLIDIGKIRPFNEFEYLTQEEYIKYNKKMHLAYEFRMKKLKGLNREMECIYISGVSGSGKTTYAKKLASDKGYSTFVSSGSNDVLDGYEGQDCIILDDLRPSCMGLSDLLKMLDNNTSSTVKSRYRNKVLECKLIIITSIMKLDDFYFNVFSEQNEPIIQFRRRCKTHLRITKDVIYVSIFKPSLGDYGNEVKIKNPVSDMFVSKDLSKSEELDFMKDILGNVEILEPSLDSSDFLGVQTDIFDPDYYDLEN